MDFWEKIDQIKGLSLKAGLNHVSGEKANYEKSLKLTIKDIEKSNENLVHLLESGDMNNFSIIVHGMKSTLAFIGAADLSAKAKDLEKAANLADKDFCQANLPAFLEEANTLKECLAKAFAEKPVIQGSTERPPELTEILKNLTAAFNETDFSTIDEGLKSLDALNLGGELYEDIEKIKDAVLVMEYETALKIIGNLAS